jgi:hypothetical protein
MTSLTTVTVRHRLIGRLQPRVVEARTPDDAVGEPRDIRREAAAVLHPQHRLDKPESAFVKRLERVMSVHLYGECAIGPLEGAMGSEVESTIGTIGTIGLWECVVRESFRASPKNSFEVKPSSSMIWFIVGHRVRILCSNVAFGRLVRGTIKLQKPSPSSNFSF